MSRHIQDGCGPETSVRHAVCRREEAGTEHAVLRRLLGMAHDTPLSPHRARQAALTSVDALLSRGPLVLTVGDAQWCDEGTLRCVDHLVRDASGGPLTVVLGLSPGLMSSAAAAFHELVARDYCSVVDTTGGRAAGAARPAAGGPRGPDPHELDVLRVAQAAALLRSTDVDLVSALTGFAPGVTRRLLESVHPLGPLPERIPAQGLPPLPETLPGPRDERMRVQAAEILNDAARPAGQVADLLLGQSTLDRPWMGAVLREAAAAARHDRPAAAVSYLNRLHEADPGDAAIRAELGAALLDIDPAAAREHLENALSHTDDPQVRARAAGRLRLTGLMTHRLPGTPETLGSLVRETGPGHPGAPPPPAAQPVPAGESLLAADDPTGQLLLAARALRTALRGTDPGAAVADARQVLRFERPRAAWTRVAAARVLALADETPGALDHLRRAAEGSRRREEDWAERHASSARALLLLESGRVSEAADAALAASRPAGGQHAAGPARLASVTLALALLHRGDLGRAEKVLRRLEEGRPEDSVWEHHHHLMARALVERGHGRTERALRLLERCGASLAAAGVDNPVFTTWWVLRTELFMETGRAGEAAEQAELGRHLAERWPTPRSTGLSLLARGMAAQAGSRAELLAESVRVLADSSDRHSHALAELHLGTVLLRQGDEKSARVRLRAARATALRCGLETVAARARAALDAVGDRPARPVLSDAERPVAEMAAAGTPNRAIADTLCLTVRTVEYHLTNVYRKLGVTGRAGLARRLPPHGPSPSGRTPGGVR